MYDGHGGKNRRRHSGNWAIRWIASMAAEAHRKRDWRAMAEDDAEGSAATLPLVIHSIPGRISLTDTGAAYVALLVVIMSFIAVWQATPRTRTRA